MISVRPIMTDKAFHHGKMYNFKFKIKERKVSKQNLFIDRNLNWGLMYMYYFRVKKYWKKSDELLQKVTVIK